SRPSWSAPGGAGDRYLRRVALCGRRLRDACPEPDRPEPARAGHGGAVRPGLAPVGRATVAPADRCTAPAPSVSPAGRPRSPAGPLSERVAPTTRAVSGRSMVVRSVTAGIS